MRFFLPVAVFFQAHSMIEVICMSCPNHLRVGCASILIVSSYRLLIGGSLLQSFALFMLSLTQAGQYYQARHFVSNARLSSLNWNNRYSLPKGSAAESLRGSCTSRPWQWCLTISISVVRLQ